jgi:hypothetical protein
MAVETAAPQTYLIQGRKVRLPVEVREATAAVAYYLVSAPAAQRLIDRSGLRIAQTLPGRTVCTIGSMEYIDGDLGRYHEVGVGFFVHEPHARDLPVIGTMFGLARGGLPVYVHQLPVDGEFTREAGCTIWGYPKFMSEIEVTREGGVETTRLAAEGQGILTQTMRMAGTRSFGTRRQITFTHRDGETYRTPSSMSGEQIGARMGGVTIELGTHPMADELRSLGLPKKALFSTYIGHMRATFGAAERVSI